MSNMMPFKYMTTLDQTKTIRIDSIKSKVLYVCMRFNTSVKMHYIEARFRHDTNIYYLSSHKGKMFVGASELNDALELSLMTEATIKSAYYENVLSKLEE